VNGELSHVGFRLSDQCLIGLIDLFKSITLPSGPEVTFDEIRQFRVSLVILSVIVIRAVDKYISSDMSSGIAMILGEHSCS